MSTFQIEATTSNSPNGLSLPWSAASNMPRGPGAFPAVIPASEAYYWTAKWQAQELDFEHARQNGSLIEASSMSNVIRDLMTVDHD